MNNFDKLIAQLSDLSAKEIQILEGALRGIQVAPDMYEKINETALEIMELRKAKDAVDSLINAFGRQAPAAKKRKPRSDKGKSKTVEAPADKKVEPKEETKVEKPKKEPKPKAKVKGETTPPVKETADQIKANIEATGSNDDIDKVFPEGEDPSENEIGL